MINIFTPVEGDQSVYYLTQIFGNVGNLFPLGGSAPMILGTMFKAFNTVVLAIGTLVIIYVSIVGVMKTASEGEFLGKSWNSIWIPIRMVIGIAALVPSASGYSSIQIFIMWTILQGIGAADTVWDKVLGYTDALGSPLSTITIPSVGVKTDMQYLFQGLVCQSTAHLTDSLSTTLGSSSVTVPYYCAGNSPPTWCGNSSQDLQNITTGPQAGVEGNNYVYKMGPSGYCGKMTFCANDPACSDTSQVANMIKCNACKAQAASLQDVVNVMGPIADQFAQADLEYRKFLLNPTNAPTWLQNYCQSIGASGEEQCCVPPTQTILSGNTGSSCKIDPSFDGGGANANTKVVQSIIVPFNIKSNVTQDIDFITASVNDYVDALSNAAMNGVQTAVDNKTSFSKDELNEAHKVGWIFAGAYYYYLAQQNNKNVDASLPDLSVTGSSPNGDQNNPLRKYRNNYDVASSLMTEVSNLTTPSNQSSGGDFSQQLPPQLQDLSKLSDGLKSSGSSVMDGFYSMITGAKAGQLATNPLTQLQTLGKTLLIIAQVLFALIMVVIPAMTLLGYFDVYVLGTGFNNPLGGTITTLVVLFAPLFAVFIGSLFTFGALLAVYTPLIPYIVFTMGAISWFILVIEAMVAAPLVAIGILSPSGQHEVLGKAEHAVMYVFSIFLRPTLMIFGLVAAMLLSVVVVTMINAAFSGVMGQIYSNPGLVEILLFLGAYVGLVLAALNKCFALIHIVPDRVLRWIGGHPEESSGAAGEGLAGSKEGVGAASKGAMGIGAGMKGQMEKGAKKTDAKQKEDKKEKEDKERIQLSDSGKDK